jgi:hypothetical protein
MDNLRTLEVAIHRHEVRTSIDKLTELLHPGFIEIGYSGKTYDFNSMLENLPKLPLDFIVWSQDYEFYEYAPNIVQVNYLSANLEKDGSLSRHAKRTSIWVKESSNWQMRFHQGTPIAAFEKSNA